MQEHIWEREYQNPQLIRLDGNPTRAVSRFSSFLKKEGKIELSNLHILDLGCGIGKNSHYIAEQGVNNSITGIDISETALKHARELAPHGTFIKGSIGAKLPFTDSSFDIILDVTSSNSLTEDERKIYLAETHRLLKGTGFFFIRALCKDGDANAKNLLASNPGKEKDTYSMPEIGLIERVFSKEDFISTYSPFFEILFMKKETHYSKFKDRLYKRNFWVVYLKKGVLS